MLIARMKPGETLATAQADTDRLAEEFERANPIFHKGYTAKINRMRIQPFQQEVIGDVRTPLLVLFGAVGFVLLIACVNVADLLLSRAAGRQREVAIRAALGASTGRIFRQLLCESVVLASFAGVAGIALGMWGTRALVAMSPLGLPRIGELTLDWHVLLFAAVIATLVALACGSVASFQALRSDMTSALKQAAAPLGAISGRTLSRVLAGGEIALSLVLLSGAALLIATMIHLYRVPTGFDATNVTSVRMSLFSDKYKQSQQVARFQQQLVERVRQLPDVVSVATASATPLERGLHTVVFKSGAYSSDPNDPLLIEYRAISPDYFRTLGIPLLGGRSLTEADAKDSARVAVINDSLARTLWPQGSALGRQVMVAEGPAATTPPRLIVGVVADIKEIGLDQPARATVYVPQEQVADSFNQMTNYWFATSLLVKTAQPLHLENELRSVIHLIDPEEPISSIAAMADVTSGSVAQQRFFMVLMGTFAVLALLLAGVGIYGVLSYQVARRTREIGIRMALGASRAGVLRQVLGEELRVILAGVAVGLAGSLAATRLLAGLLFGVQPSDPGALGIVVVVLVSAGLGACYVPAWRATRVDPLVALRYE